MVKDKPENAFILAAGQGKRLRPYTDTMPKPMVPVNGRPILDYTLEKLSNEGVKNVTVNLFYLGDRIKNYLSERQNPTINFSQETELLDTGGGVKNAIDTINGNAFYLINGDAFWTDSNDESALSSLASKWDPEKMDILLLLQPIERMTLTKGVGDYDLNEDGCAIRCHNKNGTYMFAGIRITKPEIFEDAPDGAFSFLELMDKAEQAGRLYGLVHKGNWHHISTPEDLDRVNAALAQVTPQAKSA